MFIPQCPEQDCYDTNGQQTDDINSLMEFIQVAAGYDKTADDEDDDNGNNFLLIKNCDFIHQQQQFHVISQPLVIAVKKKNKFPFLKEHISSISVIEVATPPPDFTSPLLLFPYS